MLTKGLRTVLGARQHSHETTGETASASERRRRAPQGASESVKRKGLKPEPYTAESYAG